MKFPPNASKEDLDRMEDLSGRIEEMRRTKLVLYQDPECQVLLLEAINFNNHLIAKYGDYFKRPK
jgi:hypothetical protein